MSKDWLSAVRTVMESELASVDLHDVDFTYSEEVTHAPRHLWRRDSFVGWHFALRNVRISVEPARLWAPRPR